MKAFIMACVAAIVLAVIGGVVLNVVQKPADHSFSSSESVRLDS
jgi:cell division protein FtsN